MHVSVQSQHTCMEVHDWKERDSPVELVDVAEIAPGIAANQRRIVRAVKAN